MKKKAAKSANGKSNGKSHGKSNGKPAVKRRKKMAKMRATYELNDKERKVWEAFPAPKDGEDAKEVKLAELAADAFPKKGTAPKSKPNSWVRNSLRKLQRLGLVKHKGAKSGTYVRTKLTPEEVLEDAEKKGLINTKEAEEKKPKRSKKKASAEKAAEATT